MSAWKLGNVFDLENLTARNHTLANPHARMKPHRRPTVVDLRPGETKQLPGINKLADAIRAQDYPALNLNSMPSYSHRLRRPPRPKVGSPFTSAVIFAMVFW
jgi:hypothetical protein